MKYYQKGVKKEKWNHSEDDKVWKSCAVIAANGRGCNLLLYAYGPAIDWYIREGGTDCKALKLRAPGPGLWVWEGDMDDVQYSSPVDGEDWDLEVVGEWRDLTEDEWILIENGECPWDKTTLPKWGRKSKAASTLDLFQEFGGINSLKGC